MKLNSRNDLIALRQQCFLRFETFSLIYRIVQLGVRIRHLPAIHKELETLCVSRILRFLLRKRRNLNRMVHNKGRLD